MDWNTKQGHQGRSSALLSGGDGSRPPLGGEAVAVLRCAEGSERLGCLSPGTQHSGARLGFRAPGR